MINSDVILVPPAYKKLATDSRIEFQLAVRDPMCKPTNGITRRYTKTISFKRDEPTKTGVTVSAVKSSKTGGADPWPRDKYLNLWVCNLSGVIGQGTFPGSVASRDGVIIRYTTFGHSETTLDTRYNMGRTAVHEIGHWLNLHHLWGDGDQDGKDNVACTGDDFVKDTPTQQASHDGCDPFPSKSCGNDGDMSMNYMDYGDDVCTYMFTAGQSTRMDAALYGPRSAILGSDGLIPPPSTVAANLWSQDTPKDFGAEPDTVSEKMWLSDDIWVRNTNDGIGNQDHQNPVYKPAGLG